jgi:hypothetical protein
VTKKSASIVSLSKPLLWPYPLQMTEHLALFYPRNFDYLNQEILLLSDNHTKRIKKLNDMCSALLMLVVKVRYIRPLSQIKGSRTLVIEVKILPPATRHTFGNGIVGSVTVAFRRAIRHTPTSAQLM